MIQRIQTVYLLLAVVLLLVYCFLPIGHFTIGDNGKVILTLFSQKWIQADEVALTGPGLWGKWILGYLTIFATALTFFTIFGFKNRKSQIQKCKLAMSLLLIFGVGYVADVYLLNMQIGGNFHIDWPCIFPILAFVAILKAKIHIQKDEELVKAADRIR